MSAAQAQPATGNLGIPPEIHALSAFLTHYPLRFCPRHVGWINNHAHPLLDEEFFSRQIAIGLHLLQLFGFKMRIESGGKLSRILPRNDANGPAAGNVDKGGSHLAPVAKLEGTLTQPAVGNQRNCIRRTAIDFDVRNNSLAIRSSRVNDAEPFKAEKSQAHAQYLPGAHVAMGNFGLVKEFVERIHA